MKIGHATSSDGVTWDEDAGNPVLDVGASGAWDDASLSSPDVLHDGSIYRMFYTGYDGDQTIIGYAMGLMQSDPPHIDQTDWVKYPAHTDLESPVSHPSALFFEDTYHLWVVREQEFQRSICYAQSANGVTWENYPGNPVLRDGIEADWDGEFVSEPSVLYDGTVYRMWYAGYDGTKLRIGYATSADGVDWTKHASNPVLDAGASGAWDDAGVSSPSVLVDGSGYHMWYSGYDGITMRIGYATSTDGVDWTKHASNPVLDVGAGGVWDSEGVSSPSVLDDGTGYALFYTGSDGDHTRIGYATSADGVVWNRDSENLVLDVGGNWAWDSEGLSNPSVLVDETRYSMFYTGYDGDHLKIGFAVGQESVGQKPNAPPVAADDAYSVDEDIPLDVGAPGVLGNDSDVGRDPLTAEWVSGPSNGVLALNADGSFTYTPDADFHGMDSFTYRVSDGELNSNEATVTITVNPVNDAPSFVKGADQDVLEDAGAQTVAGWATGISAGPEDEAGQALTFTASADNDGLFSAVPSIDATGTLTYTPADDANGSAVVTMTVSDNGGTDN
ncbi:MAG: tandem-95 repeat protein, partial [Candidatus Latescibacteria bacterium]|nr:tandem-95 repeat protein [Candidatus Latescibacterota bacterium]